MASGIGPIIVSILIFGLTYAGILTEKVHRTLVALVGAIAMLCAGTFFSFYSPASATAATDANTIELLFGMMLIVGLFRATGFFEYVAIRVARWAHGRAWLLFVYLGLATTIVSMFLDNVTTIILMIPVSMSLADILEMPVTPFLISEVMLSNIGGVATLIGDPPNILIGSAAGLTFTDFVLHLAPIVIVVWLCVQLLLLWMFRRTLRRGTTSLDRLLQLDPRRALVDSKTTRRMLAVLGFTVALFFVHERIGLDSGMVALVGAGLGLIWLRPPIRETLQEIHWDVLLFFISLFVIVGGLEAAGTLAAVTRAIAGLTRGGVLLASLVVLWAAAIMSAVVDNVPFTIAMLPVLAGLAEHGVSAAPLWWALALGVGFGGNATPIGATANVIAVSFGERAGEPISARAWTKRGIPAALLACTVASLLDLLAIELGFF
jgi:Na+/H+ antiporter NhaD/arsenite permease-like protein